MANPNPNATKIENLLEQRQRDLGGMFTSLADIHPDIAEGFIAKMRNFIDDDPALLDDKINIGSRESLALQGAFKKLKDYHATGKWAAIGASLGRGSKTEEPTSALVVSEAAVETTSASEYQTSRKKHLETLGLPENATSEEIKKAYRQKMIENHPDMKQNRGASAEELDRAHEETIKINDAAGFLFAAAAAQQAAVEPGVSPQLGPSGGGIIQGLGNQGIDIAKGKIQGKIQGYVGNLTKRFTQKATKEVAETAAKTATKTAVKTGAKVAVSTAAKVGVEAAFASTGVGLIVDLVIEVGTRLVSLLGKAFNKLNRLISSITGSNSKAENFSYIMLAGGGMIILAGGSPILGLGAVGLGAAGMYSPGLITGMVGGILLIPVVAFNIAVAMLVNLFQTTLLAIVLIVVGTTFIFFIIQFGAYVVPPGGFGTETEYGVRGQFHPSRLDPGIPPDDDFPRSGTLPSETLYLRVNKQASDTQLENNSGTQPITYTVNITASRADVTLQSLVCSNSLVSTNGETELGQNELNVNGVHISRGQSHTVTYTASVDTSTTDTSLVDRCCVLAVTDNSERGACGSAIVNIGDGPVSCPTVSPLDCSDGQCRVNQHYDTSTWDINWGTGGSADCGRPIRATHGGIFNPRPYRGDYGIYAYVDGECNGPFSTLYAHMEAYNPNLTPGQYIRPGTIIGWVDDTGDSSACHLHYENRYCTINNGVRNCNTYTCPSDSYPCYDF